MVNFDTNPRRPKPNMRDEFAPEAHVTESAHGRTERPRNAQELEEYKRELGYRDWKAVNAIFHFDEWAELIEWEFRGNQVDSVVPVDITLTEQVTIKLPAPKELYLEEYKGTADGVEEQANFAQVTTGRTSGSNKLIIYISFWNMSPESEHPTHESSRPQPVCTMRVQFEETYPHNRDLISNSHGFGSDRTMLIRPAFAVWSPKICKFEDSVYPCHHRLNQETENIIAEVMKQYGDKV